MCDPGGVLVNDPAVTLSRIFKDKVDVEISAAELRVLIGDNWGKISVLAHAIHDEEKSSMREHIRNVAALDADGIRNVLAGTATKAVIDSFKEVAKAVLK